MSIMLCAPDRAPALAASAASQAWLYFADDADGAAQLRRACPDAREIAGSDGFNAIALAQREAYSDFIGGLGRTVDREAWLTSSLYARFYHDPVFRDVCRLLYAAARRDELRAAGSLLIVCDRRGLARALQGVFPDAVPDAGSWRESRWSVLRQTFTARWRIVVDLLRRARVLRAVPHTRPGTILLRSWADARSLTASGAYRDEYFGVLPAWLQAQGGDCVVAPYPFTPETARRLGNCADKSPRLVFYEREIGWLRLALLLIRSWRLPAADFSAARFAGSPVGAILDDAWRREHRQGRRLYCDLERLFITALARRGWRPERVIYPMENQPWERAFCASVRAVWPECRLIAYVHSPLIPAYMFYRRAAAENDYAPEPDRILTTSAGTCALLRGFGYRVPVRVGGALREPAPDAAPLTASGAGSIVVLLSTLPEASRLLLSKAVAWAGEANDLNFIVRPHPIYAPPRNLWPDLPNLRRDCGTLAAALAGAVMVVYNDTTACYTALARGIPVACCPPDYLVHYDPLEAWPECRTLVRSVAELRLALRQKVPDDVREQFSREVAAPTAADCREFL